MQSLTRICAILWHLFTNAAEYKAPGARIPSNGILNHAISDTTSTAEWTYDPSTGLDGQRTQAGKGTNSTCEISGTFADGTSFRIDAFPEEGVVTNTGSGSQGWWGEYSDWSSTPDAKTWTISFHDSASSTSGSMKFKSIAPPHLPCGPVQAGATEMLMPHVGWANAVPSAVADVNFNINGTQLSFSGSGYHDKLWGDQALNESVGSWYMGHGRLGPFGIVRVDARSLAGEMYPSSYVHKDGVVLSQSCGDGSVVVWPWGRGWGDDPDGLMLAFRNEGKEMEVNVTDVVATGEDSWLGTLQGGFTNGTGNWTGVAQYMKMKF